MQHAERVGIRDGVAGVLHVLEQAQALVMVRPLQRPGQRPPADQAHGVEGLALRGHAGVVDRDDHRVVERGRVMGLGDQAGRRVATPAGHLDRHVTRELAVPREVHLAHAADGDHRLAAVAIVALEPRVRPRRARQRLARIARAERSTRVLVRPAHRPRVWSKP